MSTLLKVSIALVALSTGIVASYFALTREPEQTHASPWGFSDDDVQYFAPGQEFKLPKEAAALKQYAAEQQLQNAQGR